jgi:hypothetical protein
MFYIWRNAGLVNVEGACYRNVSEKVVENMRYLGGFSFNTGGKPLQEYLENETLWGGGG